MDEHGPDAPESAPSPQRKYLPTFAELVDRLSIVQLKAIFIPGRRQDYVAEAGLIAHDINLVLAERGKLTARDIRAIMIIMLANRYIWENESKAREGGPEQDKLLKLTHSINGVRNRAKNVLAEGTRERTDYKVDCFAADLADEFGNWNVF